MSTRPSTAHSAYFRPSRIRKDDSLATGHGESYGPRGGGLDLGKGAPEFDEHEVNTFGMSIFLASLAMIFGATLAAYGIFRWREGESWNAAEPFRNLLSIALATLALLACDLLVARARRRETAPADARRLTLVSLLLALAYMVVQGWNWALLLGAAVPEDGQRIGMEATLFLVLTFTHAAHVLCGVIANTVIVVRSSDGRAPRRVALELNYRYWRFLTIVWVVIAVVLIAT